MLVPTLRVGTRGSFSFQLTFHGRRASLGRAIENRKSPKDTTICPSFQAKDRLGDCFGGGAEPDRSDSSMDPTILHRSGGHRGRMASSDRPRCGEGFDPVGVVSAELLG